MFSKLAALASVFLLAGTFATAAPQGGIFDPVESAVDGILGGLPIVGTIVDGLPVSSILGGLPIVGTIVDGLPVPTGLPLSLGIREVSKEVRIMISMAFIVSLN